jgi:hypothetical protein
MVASGPHQEKRWYQPVLHRLQKAEPSRSTKFDSELMGNPEDMVAQLDGKKFFTKIDLSKGYWQIPMEEDSKAKPTFITPDSCYQFRRMPFGLVNSAATFNQMMRKMLVKSVDISHYVDDILAHTSTWEEGDVGKCPHIAHAGLHQDFHSAGRCVRHTCRPRCCPPTET